MSTGRFSRKRTFSLAKSECFQGPLSATSGQLADATIDLWRVPNGRRVGPVLNGHRYLIRHRNAKALGIISGPARRWDFDYANVVKGVQIGIEFRISPVSYQQCITDELTSVVSARSHLNVPHFEGPECQQYQGKSTAR